ncbi:hypothetical protein FRUB_02887 [Fimbriiglobus ruber]|uniref:Uncharacterized protein n=1 Tax=Fimbriiglobus ruber TaxID=1908690 RepID=A0A225DXM8_9BACT|nr:hypothetical protein FRUB_02887 [Fimbriiglobus ruber]
MAEAPRFPFKADAVISEAKATLIALAEEQREGGAREVLRNLINVLSNCGWDHFKTPGSAAALGGALSDLAALETIQTNDVNVWHDALDQIGFDPLAVATGAVGV